MYLAGLADQSRLAASLVLGVGTVAVIRQRTVYHGALPLGLPGQPAVGLTGGGEFLIYRLHRGSFVCTVPLRSTDN